MLFQPSSTLTLKGTDLQNLGNDILVGKHDSFLRYKESISSHNDSFARRER